MRKPLLPVAAMRTGPLKKGPTLPTCVAFEKVLAPFDDVQMSITVSSLALSIGQATVRAPVD